MPKYIIKVWETKEEREQGISNIIESGLSNIEETIEKAKKIMDSQNYVSLEVQDSKEKRTLYYATQDEETEFSDLVQEEQLKEKVNKYAKLVVGDVLKDNGEDVFGLVRKVIKHLEDIIKYRQDGLGVALREALRSFEDYCNNGLNGENLLDRDSILERAEKFQKQIRTAIGELTPQKYKEFNMIEKCITTSIKIGGFGVGGVLGYTIDGGIATVAGISGFSGAVLSEILTYPKAQEAVNWVVEACLSHKNSKYMVNLWKCKKMIG